MVTDVYSFQLIEICCDKVYSETFFYYNLSGNCYAGRGLHRPIARGMGVQRTIPNQAKGPLLATRKAKNGVFASGLRERASRSPFLGVPHLLKIDSSYEPVRSFHMTLM